MVYRNRLHQHPLVETGPRDAGTAQRRRREIETWKKTAEQWIATHPGPSLGIALGLGVLVAWLIKRK